MIGLVSDTHGLLRPEVAEILAGAERILHMGDVGSAAVLDGLRAIAPVVAVRGNVDQGAWAAALPETAAVPLPAGTALLIHDLASLRAAPPGTRLVLFGHTHRPLAEERGGTLYVNPGSAGPRRFDLPISLALLHDDLRVEFRTIVAPWPA